MKVVHCLMTVGGAGPTVYRTFVVDCRGHRASWTGRALEATGARLTLPHGGAANLDDLDALARSEAARLGLPAGPDVFPMWRAPSLPIARKV